VEEPDESPLLDDVPEPDDPELFDVATALWVELEPELLDAPEVPLGPALLVVVLVLVLVLVLVAEEFPEPCVEVEVVAVEGPPFPVVLPAWVGV
jgi:hypothetical protein